jgi:hypothetical protein
MERASCFGGGQGGEFISPQLPCEVASPSSAVPRRILKVWRSRYKNIVCAIFIFYSRSVVYRVPCSL